MRLTKTQLTQAIGRYARRHGYSASTVRTCTSLRMAAIREWKDRQGKKQAESRVTTTQIERWAERLWRSVTRADGYQPFGHDLRTMKITHPHYVAAHERLRALWVEADQRWADEQNIVDIDLTF